MIEWAWRKLGELKKAAAREVAGLPGRVRFSELLRQYREDELPGAPWFREAGRTVVETMTESSPEALVGYLSTTSRYLVLSPEERDKELADVHAVAARYGEQFPVPRVTYVFAYAAL